MDISRYNYDNMQVDSAVHRQIGPTFRYKVQVLKRILRPMRDLRILDLGCGDGYFSELLAASGNRMFAADVSPLAAQQTRERCGAGVNVAVTDAHLLPFECESMDAVLCLDVIEHCRDDDLAISELSRVLVPGGTAVIAVPANPRLYSSLDRASGHFRRYTYESMAVLVDPYFNTEVMTDFGYPLMRAYTRLLAQVTHGSRPQEPTPAMKLVANIAYALMQFDHLFEGNRKGVQLLYVGTRPSREATPQ